MVEEALASLTIQEAPTTSLSQLGKFRIKNKWLLLEILMFASTDKFPVDMYMYKTCKSTRHLLFKCDQDITLYQFLIFNFIPLPLPELYIIPRKERRVLKEMLTKQDLYLGKILYNEKSDMEWDPARQFHLRCDEQGPTITLIQIRENKNWIGGYASKSWSRVQGMMADQHAFLFNLSTSKIFKVKRTHSAQYHHPKRGPSFGFDDLVTYQEDENTYAKGEGWDYTYGNTNKINNLTQTMCDKEGVASFYQHQLQVWTVTSGN